MPVHRSVVSKVATAAAAGQQESKVESLESIHAARLRSGSEAGTSAPHMGQSAAPVAKSQSGSDSEADNEPAFANGGLGEPDAETDPYNLPVSHEVALEGVSLDNSNFCIVCSTGRVFLFSTRFTGMHGCCKACMTVTRHL